MPSLPKPPPLRHWCSGPAIGGIAVTGLSLAMGLIEMAQAIPKELPRWWWLIAVLSILATLAVWFSLAVSNARHDEDVEAQTNNKKEAARLREEDLKTQAGFFAQVKQSADEQKRLTSSVMQSIQDRKDRPPLGTGLQANLKHRALELADEILSLLIVRQANEPAFSLRVSPIDPVAWKAEIQAQTAYMWETMNSYSRNLAARVIVMRKEFAEHGLRDEKLDEQSEYPTNPIGIRLVAEHLAALAYRLPDA
jgi:hypothetical protein